ncbi:thiamine pyrophosphate-binding protein, partial [Bacteroides heparinolyticus]|uniref:thiamine pyrophosphate-binding protein n=1 Tax=Prevotella heparinolytica TaxID=28113 RepID=UPI00359FD633
MKIRVSDYIAKKVVEHGIVRAFSVTGGGAMFLNDALGHREGLQVLYNHHEQASAIAAESYARIYDSMALLCVTTGPGGTNAITGVVGAWLDSIPMLVLSGQVRYDCTARSTGLGIRALGDQEFDICQSVACMTKYCEMLIQPERVRYCLEKAIYLAKSGRPGPTWLDIPLDVQSAFVEEESLVGFDIEDYEEGGNGWKGCDTCLSSEDSCPDTDIFPKKPDKELIRRIIEKIKAARRPVLNAGNGIRIGRAHEVFVRLVDKLGIPTVVGWNSEDCLWDEHPLYGGRPGNFGDRAGNFAVQNADLVLSIGSRLSLRQVGFNYKGWAREAFTIVNDIDKEELKKPTLHVSLPVHADCKVFMEALLEELAQEKTPLWSGGEGIKGMNWLETVGYWRRKYPVCREEFMQEDAGKLANVYAFIRHISEKAREGQITVVGNGSACVVGGHSYIIKK